MPNENIEMSENLLYIKENDILKNNYSKTFDDRRKFETISSYSDSENPYDFDFGNDMMEYINNWRACKDFNNSGNGQAHCLIKMANLCMKEFMIHHDKESEHFIAEKL